VQATIESLGPVHTIVRALKAAVEA
jgi:hypothetical protein